MGMGTDIYLHYTGTQLYFFKAHKNMEVRCGQSGPMYPVSE